MVNPTIGFALLLSALAGLSTGVGSLLGLVVRKPGPRFMALTLSFSAGAMILVSFVRLLPESIEAIGFGPAHLAFFGGMLALLLIDALIPHEYMAEHRHGEEAEQKQQLMRTGLLVAVGIAIHNFPEGMASFVGALQDPKLGIAIAIAVAVHNIPEGVAVSAPVYAATGSRGKAFLWSLLSGVAEPIGAGLAALVLAPFLGDVLLGIVAGVVAGIMVAISIDELLPVSRSFGEEHLSLVGIIAGMAVMALSLLVL